MKGNASSSRRHALKNFASVEVAINHDSIDALIRVIQKDICYIGGDLGAAKTLVDDLDVLFGLGEIRTGGVADAEKRALRRGGRLVGGHRLAAAVAGLKSGFEHRQTAVRATFAGGPEERGVFDSLVPVGRRLTDHNLSNLGCSIRNAVGGRRNESDIS